ncbi:MAG: hypothetical protein N2167_03435 [Flavobacteriales bacterium]|nr:hypothetical protein [Flavobacteriales bacterium]
MYVINQKFSINIANDEAFLYYYFSNENNLQSLGDLLKIQGETLEDEINEIYYYEGSAPYVQYYDFLVAYLEGRFFQINQVYQFASVDSIIALNDYEATLLKSKFNKCGIIPSMKTLVPHFLYYEIVYHIKRNSLQLANLNFSNNFLENYKNKNLKNIISLINKNKAVKPVTDFLHTDFLDTNKLFKLSDFLGKNLIIDFGSTYCFGYLKTEQSVHDRYSNIKNKSELLYIDVLIEKEFDHVKTFGLKNKFLFSILCVSVCLFDDVFKKYAIYFEPRFVLIDKQEYIKETFFTAIRFIFLVNFFKYYNCIA